MPLIDRPSPAGQESFPSCQPTIYFFANHSSAGGVGEVWSDLAAGLGARGFRTRLVALWPRSDPSAAVDDRIAWHCIVAEKPRSLRGLLHLVKKLVKFLRTETPDCVVTAMPASNLLVPAIALKADKSIRAITSYHTTADGLKWPMNWLDRYSAVPPNVVAAVCVSKSVATSYWHSRSWLRSKQRIIANALSPAVERHLSKLSHTRQPRLGGESIFRIVSLGRLSDQKNYDVLITAASYLSNVTVSIIGEGPDEARLRALVERLGVGDRVMFQGFMNRLDALRAVAAADVFVQMSRFEGHSLALIEAAKLGLPLVVSNVPAQLEGITDDTGRICGIPVELDDARGLARWISRLSSDPDFYADMASRSQAVARALSFDRTLLQYEKLVLQLPNTGGNPESSNAITT